LSLLYLPPLLSVVSHLIVLLKLVIILADETVHPLFVAFGLQPFLQLVVKDYCTFIEDGRPLDCLISQQSHKDQ
jgi:hypothetical protein